MHLTLDGFNYSIRRFDALRVELAETVNVLKEHFNIPKTIFIESVVDRRTHKYRWLTGARARVEVDNDATYYRTVHGPWCQDNVHAFVSEATTTMTTGRSVLLLVERSNNITGRPRKSTKEFTKEFTP